MFSRRLFLQMTAAAGGLAITGCQEDLPIKAAARQISKIGIQTYTLREIFKLDPLATLKMIKAAGYDYVELNNRNFADLPPAELRAMIDDLGLYAPSTHISLDMIQGDLSGLIETCKTLGVKYAVVPYIDDNQRGYDDWKSHAAAMNRAGKILKDNNIHLAYHNHQFEFEDLGGGTTAMDVLFGDCLPENLDFQLDIFWTALADVDIEALLRAHPGRFKLCHVKDMNGKLDQYRHASYEEISANLMVNVGEGVIPFERYFSLNNISGMEYFIAEHDNPRKPFAQAIKTSYEAMKAMRF